MPDLPIAADVVACTPVHQLPDGEVRLLGAIDVVTGAMTRVEIGGCSLLVDCGIGQGAEARRWRFPDAARNVDAVLLTHGHLDHIGSLPMLLDGDFNKPIVATRATLEVARMSLEDAMEMQQASRREVDWFLRRFDSLVKPVPYDEQGALPGLPLQLTFREAGHIIGSASVDIVGDKSRVILSGDLGRPDSPILRDPFTAWPAGRAVDVVVMESTYGNRDHAHSHDDIEAQLCRVITETAARRGKIFIPAFAIGRTQVLLWFLNRLVEQRRIPPIPVAVDTPMGLHVTEIYRDFERFFDKESLAQKAHGDDPLDFDALFAVNHGRDSWKLVEAPGPLIVIAGSGMVSGGRIIRHLVDGLPDERNTLLFAGHQATGTPGRRIQDAANTGGSVWLDQQQVPVRAHVETLKGLSAHADRTELRAWLSHVPAFRRVALHHGEAEAQRSLASWLMSPSSSAPPSHDDHVHHGND